MTGSVGPILMAGVSCMGEEGELFNCSSLVEFCEDRGVRAGVRCHFGKFLQSFYISTHNSAASVTRTTQTHGITHSPSSPFL